MAPAQNGIQQYVKLEERLVLLAWLNDLFGYQHNRDLLADMKEAAEGCDASGCSFISHRLIARGEKVKIPPTDLARYDDNICAHLQEAVTNILRQYTDDFYRIRREQWESHHMVYRPLDESDPNLSFNRQAVKEGNSGGYVVKVQRSKRNLVSAIQKLIADAEALYRQESEALPRIYFDQHLYQPLLVEDGDQVKMTPPGLNPSEKQFVLDLKEYWAKEKDNSLVGRQVFLLRNLSRGSGIGFFEERGFYPDFILWSVNGEGPSGPAPTQSRQEQRIIFIEPHGMLHAGPYDNDEKARLHEKLPSLAQEIGARSKQKHITLDSYIISATPYEDLRKKYDDGKWDMERFAARHILFLERNSAYDYMERMFTEQLTMRCP